MRIAITVDLEGISGTVSFKQVREGHPEFERAMRLATDDVNAAIAGAREAGATRFFVQDTHGLNQINLLIDELDKDAEYVGGQPLILWESLDANYDAAFLVGYHGRAGQPDIMSHVYSDMLCDVRINDRPVGEAVIAAGLAGYYDIPSILVTGTDTVCAEMKEWCPVIETAVTKISLTRFATRCLPVLESRANIKAAAQRAVAGLENHAPLKFKPPLTLQVRWRNHQTALSVAQIPEVEFDGGEITRYTHKDFAVIDRALKAMFYIAVSPVNAGLAQVP